MDDARLVEIETRAAAATPGPWKPCGASGGKCACGLVWEPDGAFTVAVAGDSEAEGIVRPAGVACANAAFIAHAREDVPALVAVVRRLTAERDRLQRACDEGLPREVISCPACQRPHIEGPRHDDPSVDGRKRPHHTHRCYHCAHTWGAVNPDGTPRWSFGVAPAKASP